MFPMPMKGDVDLVNKGMVATRLHYGHGLMEIMLKCYSPWGCQLRGEVGGLFTLFNPTRKRTANSVYKSSFIFEI